MYTDPNHLKVSDPGRVEGSLVFSYFDAFDEETAAVEEVKQHYRRGRGLGDTAVQKRLEDVLQTLIAPIRERLAIFDRPDDVLNVIRSGTIDLKGRNPGHTRRRPRCAGAIRAAGCVA
jgi:tryptophanyl-tRNA synthetase